MNWTFCPTGCGQHRPAHILGLHSDNLLRIRSHLVDLSYLHRKRGQYITNVDANCCHFTVCYSYHGLCDYLVLQLRWLLAQSSTELVALKLTEVHLDHNHNHSSCLNELCILKHNWELTLTLRLEEWTNTAGGDRREGPASIVREKGVWKHQANINNKQGGRDPLCHRLSPLFVETCKNILRLCERQ